MVEKEIGTWIEFLVFFKEAFDKKIPIEKWDQFIPENLTE